MCNYNGISTHHLIFIISKLSVIVMSTTYYILFMRNKPWCNPEHLAYKNPCLFHIMFIFVITIYGGQVAFPTVRCSDSSIFRQFDIPTVRYSESLTKNVNLPKNTKNQGQFLTVGLENTFLLLSINLK